MILPTVRPYLRNAAKGAIQAGLQLKRMAMEAAEDLEDMAAEASADAADKGTRSATVLSTAKKE